MGRTVTVELKADVAAFLAPLKEADSATGKLDRSVEALDRDINKLPADALKAGAALDVMGAGSKRTADDAGKLDQRITELKTSTKNLSEEFAKTGDPALLKKFRADSSELAGLTKMRKEITTLGDEAKKFGQEAEKASVSVGDLFSGGLTSPAVLGGLAAAAPLLLGAAGGLTAVAAAAAVAGAGVAGAVAGNPAVFKVEWGNAIGEIKKDWIDASQPFVGPTMDAIRSIGPLVASWHIDTMFAKAATDVAPLVHGVEGFVTGVEHGIADLVDKAGPAVAVFSADLPKIGDAVGQALSLIGDNAKGGALALHDFDLALEYTVVGFGAVVSGAEATVSGLTSFMGSVKGFFDGIPLWVKVATGGITLFAQTMFDNFQPPTLAGAESSNAFGHALQGVALSSAIAADQAKATADDFTTLQKTLTATKVDADSLAESMSLKILTTTMSLDQATLHFDESLTKVGESLKANGKTLDWHTAKGQANVSAILAGVQANISAYKANVDAGMGAEAAASAYDANTAALERQLRKSGLTQASIDGLIGKYRGVPKKVDTDIAINGLTDAINSLSDLIAQINGIAGHNFHSTVTVDYIANRQGLYSNQVPGFTPTNNSNTPNSPKNGPHPHAAGGRLGPGWNLLGEQGPELEHNGWIYTASQTRSMMASSQAWGGGAAVAVSFDVSAAANTTWLGRIVNEGLRNGYIVVKASQVRAGV